jgi:hypothetical protein
MPFCAKCGKQHGKGEGFCSQCGTALREVKDVIERTVNTVERRGHKGLWIFIIFLIIVGYIALDLWAVTQLNPVFSLSSFATSISNLNVDSEGITQIATGVATENPLGVISGVRKGTGLSTTVRIENPTFVPILFGRVSYDAGYGSTKIAEGKTGWIIIGPYSTKYLAADVKISFVNIGVAGLKGLKNLIFGGSDKWNANFYADFEVTKFKIASYSS